MKWIKTNDRTPKIGEFIFIKDTTCSDISAGEVTAYVGDTVDEIILIKLSTGRYAHFETEYRFPTKDEMMVAL